MDGRARIENLPPTPEHASLGPKLHPPAGRAGLVLRNSLVERLLDSEASIITLVAPPGFGKTTVLAQLAEQIGPRVARVSCDRTDDDPATLWSEVATAIGAVADLGAAASRLLAARGGGVEVVPAFVAAIEPV